MQVLFTASHGAHIGFTQRYLAQNYTTYLLLTVDGMIDKKFSIHSFTDIIITKFWTGIYNFVAIETHAKQF